MKSLSTVLISCTMLVLTSCGGGGSSAVKPDDSAMTRGDMVAQDATTTTPTIPGPVLFQAEQSPIINFGDSYHIGPNIAPLETALTRSGERRGVTTSWGLVRDGVGADELIALLTNDAVTTGIDAGIKVFEGIERFGATPPTVVISEGTSVELITEVIFAVRAINASLPHNWQLSISSDEGPAGVVDAQNGEILIEFASPAFWPEGSPDDALGIAYNDPESFSTGELTWGRVFVDPDPEVFERDDLHLWVRTTLIHELLHALGRYHADPSQFPETVMHPYGELTAIWHIVHPLDREALLAVYGYLEPGASVDDLVTSLGAWNDVSSHIVGEIDAVPGAAFGVAWRNGLSQPWAIGPAPLTDLADNRALSGTVTWSGLIMGISSPDFRTVRGNADLGVDLSSFSGGVLTGGLDFTGRESWEYIDDSAASGTGTLWGDGALGYTIEVHGNLFTQTGGDDGIVTGAFFGSAHEAMGGTLDRQDLTAAFGGSRP